jgi:hypothetical protein
MISDRVLRRRIDRSLRKLDAQAVPGEAALALVIGGLLTIDQLSCPQLEQISRGSEWDLQGLTDTELARVASGELVSSRRFGGRKHDG